MSERKRAAAKAASSVLAKGKTLKSAGFACRFESDERAPMGRAPWENDLRYFAMDAAGESSGGFAATWVERRT